jgi:hypothetical protein
MLVHPSSHLFLTGIEFSEFISVITEGGESLFFAQIARTEVHGHKAHKLFYNVLTWASFLIVSKRDVADNSEKNHPICAAILAQQVDRYVAIGFSFTFKLSCSLPTSMDMSL